eukprot:12414225-Karenia_brevis.AAC.1
MGHSCIRDTCILDRVALGHEALQKLVTCFSIEPFARQPFAQQVPRGDNSAADRVANRALDRGAFLDVRIHAVQDLLKDLSGQSISNIGILASFDGASRGNPGPSASGICM